MQMWTRALLAFLLFCTPAFADEDDTVVVGCPAGVACNPASNEVGDRTNYAGTPLNFAGDAMRCLKVPADCSGTLGYAYFRHSGTSNENLKVRVYADGGATANQPDSGDLAVSSAGTMSSSTDQEWAQTSTKLTGSVTNGTSYWLCAVGDASVWVNYFQSTGTYSFWLNTSSSYASPPDNLDGTWAETTTNEFSGYVAIE